MSRQSRKFGAAALMTLALFFVLSLFMGLHLEHAGSLPATLALAGLYAAVFGGAMAAFCFTAYPSTSLAIFPLWHPATWHSFFYHFVMCYAGILFLWKKRYVPKVADALGYFIFITVACVIAYFLNENLGTNCMFLRHAFRLPFLDGILAASKWLYMAVGWLAQAVAMFWVNFGLYKLFEKITKKGEKQ